MEESAAISLNMAAIMNPHASKLKHSPESTHPHNANAKDIDFLTMGFQYPIESILAASVCKKVALDSRSGLYEQMVSKTHNFDILRMQDKIKQDLNSTINLLNLDPSSSLLFKFLADYPFTTNPYFTAGMEIASIIFFGLALMVVNKTGKSDWINTPYDPSMLG